MTGLLARASTFFVAPADDRPERPRSSSSPPAGAPCAVVLGAPADAVPVARLLSAELRLRIGAGCVLLAEWRSGGVSPQAAGVSPPAARRLCERLAVRGIDATSHGRTVHLPVPADPLQAVAVLERAAVAAGVPCVWALAGPRPVAFDRLLDEQDLVVLAPPADASDALARLALAGLAAVRAPVVASRPVPRGASRFLAASSVATSRALGAAVTDAVRGIA